MFLKIQLRVYIENGGSFWRINAGGEASIDVSKDFL
jgi:hypothetical protein